MFHRYLHARLFRPWRTRHPLARVGAGLLGLFALALLVVLGMFAVTVLVIGGGVFLLANALRSKPARRPQAGAAANAAGTPGIIEGEFKIVDSTPATRVEPLSTR